MELPTYAVDYRTGAIISKGDWPGCLSASSIALPYDDGESGVRREVVRRLNDYPAKVARVAELERVNADLKAACVAKDEALKRAVATIRVWNGMGVPDKRLADESWRLYQPSPEMKLITAALSTTPAEWGEYVKGLEKALSEARPIVNAHYDRGDDDYGNIEVVKALELIDAALSAKPGVKA